MNKRAIFLACAVSGLGLAGCETTIPADDTTKPVIALSVNDGGFKAVASTNPGATLNTGCPAGTTFNTAGASAFVLATYGGSMSFTPASAANIYFYSGSLPPFSFLVSGSDQGGVARVRASFNITVTPSQPEGQVVISDLTPAHATSTVGTQTFSSGNTYHYRRVEVAGDASDPRTALLMTFTASSLGGNPIVSLMAEDFSGNQETVLATLLPRTLCT